jgi:trk system potassium uptake protein
MGWLIASAIGALPFVIGIHSSFLNGYFEAMSGFTTTGITMYTGLDEMPKSILFWRALIQWVGGLGIITMFLAVNPKGGLAHHLFGAEGHKINVDRPVPGLSNTIKILLGIYILFTIIITLCLWFLGMPLFECICHSFAALATGGYSPHDASIEFYRMQGYPHFIGMEYVIIIGMIMGGTSFVIHYRVLSGSPKALIDNAEARYWWTLIGGVTILIMAERIARIAPLSSFSPLDFGFWRCIEEDFRICLFQVVSIVTTTGYGTRDITAPFFGDGARQLFLILMVIGGCVGSTGGGIKVLRVVILNRLFRREVYRQRVPSQAITTVLIDGEPVDQEEIYRVAALFFGWMVLLIIGGGITEFWSHHTGYAALSGMFSALGNVGPCFISVQDMTELHPFIKLIYIFAMLAGRLEILPVMLICSRKSWKT